MKFVAANSRVVSLKILTIPHLELQAAVLVSRLCKTIEREIRMELQESALFTDIAIVLGWIKNNGRHVKPFVASGVNEIRSNVEPAHWRQILSEQNVANDISRGLSVPELSDFDYTPQSSFGDHKANGQMEDARDDAAAIEREWKTQTVGMIWNSIYRSWCVIECKNYSSWTRLVRITAWIQRYKNKLLRRARRLPTGLRRRKS